MTTFKQIIGGMWKAAGFSRMQHSNSRGGGRGGGRINVRLPGSEIDWAQKAGVLWHNSVVAPCLEYFMDTVGEAPIVVRRRDEDGKYTIVPDHPLAMLCERPNPEYSGALLRAATVVSQKVAGNAYWKIERNGAGIPVELWYIPHWLIEPMYPTDGSVFISHYEYRPNGVPERLEKQDVIHFRNGIDPMNTRKGMSPLLAALREVVSDNEATTYTAAILANMGVPGAILEMKGEVNAGASEKLKRIWRNLFRGDGRGDIAIFPDGAKVSVPGFTPEQLVLDKIRNVPEARICAALRVDPMVIGLSVGAGQRTYSNVGEAREGTYESAVIPLQDRWADELDIQLLPQMSPVPDIEQVSWDRSEVRVLQEDMDARFKRTNDVWKSGMIKRNEGRAMLNLVPVPPEEDVYFTDLKTAPEKEEPDPDKEKGKPMDSKKAVRSAQLVLRSAAELRRRESADGTEDDGDGD